MNKLVLKRIEELMMKKNMTVYTLAVDAGLDSSTIKYWYSKNVEPKAIALEKVCEVLGVTLSQLYCFDDQMEVTQRDKDLILSFRLLKDDDKAIIERMISALNKDNNTI